MKKRAAFIIVLSILLLLFASCGKSDSKEQPKSETGTSESTAVTAEQTQTASVDPGPESYAEKISDGLKLWGKTDKSIYAEGDEIHVSFGIENNSEKKAYQICGQPINDDKFYAEASIYDADGKRVYEYSCFGGVDVVAEYSLEKDEKVERSFKYPPSKLSKPLEPGDYTLRIRVQYTFKEIDLSENIDLSEMTAECAFRVVG